MDGQLTSRLTVISTRDSAPEVVGRIQKETHLGLFVEALNVAWSRDEDNAVQACNFGTVSCVLVPWGTVERISVYPKQLPWSQGEGNFAISGCEAHAFYAWVEQHTQPQVQPTVTLKEGDVVILRPKAPSLDPKPYRVGQISAVDQHGIKLEELRIYWDEAKSNAILGADFGSWYSLFYPWHSVGAISCIQHVAIDDRARLTNEKLEQFLANYEITLHDFVEEHERQPICIAEDFTGFEFVSN